MPRPDPPESKPGGRSQHKPGGRVRMTTLVVVVAVSIVTIVGFVSSSASLSSIRDHASYALEETGIYVRGKANDSERRRLEALAEGASRFLEDRKQSYHNESRPIHWKMRGTGYLYARQNILLAMSFPETPTGGTTIVRIDDVLPWATTATTTPPRSDSGTNYCQRLTVWVRVNGPEIFAGSARAVSDRNARGAAASSSFFPSCHWEFSFDLRVPGDYRVEARVLAWDGGAPFATDPNATADLPDIAQTIKLRPGHKVGRCAPHRGGPESVTPDLVFGPDNNHSDQELVSGGFIGFKFYYPARNCCEVCTRTPGCLYWASPPAGFEASFFQNGCELYFSGDSDPEHIPSDLASGIMAKQAAEKAMQKNTTNTNRSRRLRGVDFYHGRPASVSNTPYFLGCGWSFWFTLDFPCVSGDLDDRVYANQTSFSYAPGDEPESVVETISEEEPPLPLCTIENEYSENHGGRWVRQPYPHPDDCPKAIFDNDRFHIIDFVPEKPHCWRRDNLQQIGHRCMEPNCDIMRKRPQAQWISSVHKEENWYGHWQNYACDYLEFTQSQLQECITQRKISSIKAKGASIADFLNQFIIRRLKNITMYDSKLPGAMTVTLSTLKLLHISIENQETIEEMFREEENATDSNELYWASSFYLSSERESMTYNDYMHTVSGWAETILKDKGWTMLNAYDPTAAFTYDTATQNDGMHIVGPPMKLTITKLFHHVCKDSTTGASRVGRTPRN